jgi:hypothetical protein
MSAISTVFDTLKTRIAAVLTAHSELADAYNIEANPSLFLKKGFSVAIGAGANTKRFQSNRCSVRREMVITIARALDATELDPVGKQTTAKNLLEDLKLLISDLELNATLNAGQTFVGYESDSGIQTVVADGENFLFLQATFLVEYFESL